MTKALDCTNFFVSDRLINNLLTNNSEMEDKEMALPIKPTPILKGNDAKRFLKQIKENEQPTAKEAHRAEAARIKKVFDAVWSRHKDKF